MLTGSGKPKKQFSRPSVDLSRSYGARKEWRDVHPTEVQRGDLLLGEGLVESWQAFVEDNRATGTRAIVIFTMKNGKEVKASALPEDTVRAFVSVGRG